MVQSGLGIAILPGGSVRNYHIPDTRVIGLSEKWAKRELVIGVRSIDALSPVGRLFFDHLLPS
jgi:DNA-binding transcriptional LysR family regulator